MGGRYWISGVQIGIIKALVSADAGKKQLTEVDKLMDEIFENQFIGSKHDFEKLKKPKLIIKEIFKDFSTNLFQTGLDKLQRSYDKKDNNKQRYWITEGSLSSLRKKYGVE